MAKGERKIVATEGQSYSFTTHKGEVDAGVVPAGYEREEVEVKDGFKEDGKTPNLIIHQFNILKDTRVWLAFLASAAADDAESAYDKWRYAVNMAERQSVREAAASESTLVASKKGEKIDLMGLAPKVACLAINSIFAHAAAIEGKEPANAYIVARRKWLASGKVAEKDGMLTPA